MKPKVGVMASAQLPDEADQEYGRLSSLADRLGEVIAQRDCVLITGATTGWPYLISKAVARNGGATIGISPASSLEEHLSSFRLPADTADVLIFTGFGLRGRNVINVRSSDIVIIFGGGIGTLNELMIAYDEGKIIGVLGGTGGVADLARELTKLGSKRRRFDLIFESSPEDLVDRCLRALADERRNG